MGCSAPGFPFERRDTGPKVTAPEKFHLEELPASESGSTLAVRDLLCPGSNGPSAMGTKDWFTADKSDHDPPDPAQNPNHAFSRHNRRSRRYSGCGESILMESLLDRSTFEDRIRDEMAAAFAELEQAPPEAKPAATSRLNQAVRRLHDFVGYGKLPPEWSGDSRDRFGD